MSGAAVGRAMARFVRSLRLGTGGFGSEIHHWMHELLREDCWAQLEQLREAMRQNRLIYSTVN